MRAKEFAFDQFAEVGALSDAFKGRRELRRHRCSCTGALQCTQHPAQVMRQPDDVKLCAIASPAPHWEQLECTRRHRRQFAGPRLRDEEGAGAARSRLEAMEPGRTGGRRGPRGVIAHFRGVGDVHVIQ
jgi:hypothetical protein